MPSASATSSLQFTGEGVIPGAGGPDVRNEDLVLYRFAELFAGQKRVLDVGCGSGAGTQLLAEKALQAVGFDIAPGAIAYASSHCNDATFVCGSRSALPFAAGSFGLLTAFQVIEHPDHWACLVAEAARALAPDGIFLVSTPNKSYYAEARNKSGPDSVDGHELELQNFKESLGRHFPSVQVLAPTRHRATASAGDEIGFFEKASIPVTQDLSESRFLLAVCSKRPLALPSFSYVSSTDNLLHHGGTEINSLKAELAEARADHLALWRAHHIFAEEANSRLKNARCEIDAANTSIEALLRERDFVRNSWWLRIGRILGVGPWSARSARLKALPRSLWNSTKRRVSYFFLYVSSPFLLLISALVLAAEDLCFLFIGKRQLPPETAPRNHAASIVIPNWNGRGLLEKFLPSLLDAISGSPENEVIVVDNASDDDSVSFLQERYPQVRVLLNQQNLGFALGANAGVRAAQNDVVVLLNNDMRVEPGFLNPLLENFSDPLVFAVSCQIFFSDSSKSREETGLTEVWWEAGRLRVGHRIDPELEVAYPCAYAGGGSSAFDRRKFLELGGFDSLFHPFYYEDTDLGLLAWKRGWKVLYQPASVVHHEHRGTIGKNFSGSYINGVVRKNGFLYCWKNIHDWKMLGRHFAACLSSSLKATKLNDTDSFCTPVDVRRVSSELVRVAKSRWKAASRRKISDNEAFRRPLGGYYRDRFMVEEIPPPDRLNVLFAAPYPIDPPVHGGAVFMREALTRLASAANVHLVSFVDFEEQLSEQNGLLAICASAIFMRRPYVPPTELWTLDPYGVREFAFRDFAWLLHRTMYTKNIDVVQLEYTSLGQYAGEYKYIPCILFEHDIAFQALRRRIRSAGATRRLLLEYFRMRLYEPKLLRRVARVQVCTRAGADYLQHLVPRLKGRIDWNVRAGIDVSKYSFVLNERERDTLLFVGTFRHLPNRYALTWFVEEVLPIIVRSRPGTVLVVVGSDPPQSDAVWINHPHVRVLGAVADVRSPLERYCVFVCPIRSGSGVRVKLLEAFACGIPAVSTTIGAEGLTSESGEICELADTPVTFAAATLKLLQDGDYRTTLAERARRMVERDRNSRDAAVRLEATYRAEVTRRRTASHT